MGLKERLLLFIEYKGLNKGLFERMANLSNGFVDKAGDNTRISTIDRISISFPDLNTVWLRTGQGEMLNTGNINIKGDSNITNTGVTSGDFIIGADQELNALRKKVKELEEENNQLKKDKAILQEFVTFLQNKNSKD